VSGERRVSHAELNAISNRLAHRLRDAGVEEEGVVAIGVRRSLETVAAILSVLKAGGAFLPLDPDDPPERLRAVIEDARPRAVVAAAGDRARFAAADVPCLDPVADSGEDGDPGSSAGLGHAACVYYTSGSSGQAKGVVLEHGSVLGRLTWVDEGLLGDRPLAMPLLNRLTFAASLIELGVAWLRGGPIWLPGDESGGDPVALLRALGERPGVALHCVPHMWEGMLDAVDAGRAPLPETIALLCLTGEAPGRRLVDRSFARLPDLEAWNIYGSTESGTSTAARLAAGEPPRLGRPVTGVEALVLDADRRPAAVGEAGELHIGGPGLARGYLRRPELTAERFVAHPHPDRTGSRLFWTGDVARRRADGSLEFVARRERLMKIRGVRVEPDEVEAALEQHPGVSRGVVTAGRDQRGRERLVAHVVPAGGPPLTLAELRDFLLSRLPSYMVPSQLVLVDGLPTTRSGKVDRRALRDSATGPGSGPVPEAPRTELERCVVAVWQDVLRIDRVGSGDDFFELGGDSLSALVVVDELRRRTGVALAPTVMLEAPTPALIAALIARSRPGAESSPLVTIRADGSRRPFFCAAPLPAALLPLRRLAGHLDADRPVHVLQAAGLDDGDAPVRRLAARYVAAIREVQPAGPYLLGGQCFGGVIALEAAQQLRSRGDEVSLLTLFDVPPPPLRTTRAPRERRALARAAESARRLLRVPRRSLSALRTALGEARRLGTVTPRVVRSLYRRRRRWALFEWPRADPYPGRVCLFLSTGLAETLGDPEARWGTVVHGSLDTVVVPSSHEELLSEPAVGDVAAQLNGRLEAAEGSA
jgi:amino acid adenylation domain-containing protein